MTDITKRMAAMDSDLIVSEIFRAMDAERGKPDIEPGFYSTPFVAEWSARDLPETIICRVDIRYRDGKTAHIYGSGKV